MSTHKDARIDAMFSAGMHLGYSKTRRNPSIAEYIFTTKNNVDIINLEKTVVLLDKALDFIKELGSKGKTVLFVGVKPEAKEIVLNTAQSLGMPYVTERWVGGALTNFSEIKKRIDRLEDLKQKKESGELEKYTKKERLLIDEEIAKMHGLFYGLSGLKKTPDALVVFDPKKESIAVLEAKKMDIPVIALLSTDNNIKNIDYPVVGNDSSRSSITLFAKMVQEAYRSSIVSK